MQRIGGIFPETFVVNVLNNLHNQCVFHKGSCGRTEARSKTRKKKRKKKRTKQEVGLGIV